MKLLAENRVALITGAAGGIGGAVAEILEKEGATCAGRSSSHPIF